jgi:fructosamine-3-kinase
MCEPTINDIIQEALGRSASHISPIEGQGVANHVWEVREGRDAYILKCNTNSDEANTFLKEAWCMTAARGAGVPGAMPVAMGCMGGTNWLMQTKIEGMPGNLFQGDHKILWREMGRAAALLNTIPVNGFGTHADFSAETPIFDQPSWEQNISFLAHDLFADDILIRSGTLTAAQNAGAQNVIEQMKKWGFQPVLTHHDILPKNTIMGWNGRTHLIDYGLAGGGRGAISELASILAFAKDKGAAEAFCEGYGMTDRDYQSLQPELAQILLLRVLLHARWAAYYQVPEMDSHIDLVRKKAAFLLQGDSEQGIIRIAGMNLASG